MFRSIRLRISDMKTIIALGHGAEKHASLSGYEKAGAEHYVLVVLELPDGRAARIFSQLGINSDVYKASIEGPHKSAMEAIRMSSEKSTPEPIGEPSILLQVQSSGSELMKNLHALKIIRSNHFAFYQCVW